MLDQNFTRVDASLTNASTKAFDPLDGIPKVYDLAIFRHDAQNAHNWWTEEQTFLPSVIVYGLAFLVGVVGNILVVFTILGDRKARSVTTTFLVSLSLADLLFLLICVPYEFAKSYIVHWAAGKVMCKLTGFVEMLTAIASILNLTAVSVER